MPIVMASGRALIAAYDGDPSLGLVLGYARLELHGRWKIRVGARQKYRRRRRSALRCLHRLAVAQLVDKTLARAAIARREAIGGGVLEYRTGGDR